MRFDSHHFDMGWFTKTNNYDIVIHFAARMISVVIFGRHCLSPSHGTDKHLFAVTKYHLEAGPYGSCESAAGWTFAFGTLRIGNRGLLVCGRQRL